MHCEPIVFAGTGIVLYVVKSTFCLPKREIPSQLGGKTTSPKPSIHIPEPREDNSHLPDVMVRHITIADHNAGPGKVRPFLQGALCSHPFGTMGHVRPLLLPIGAIPGETIAADSHYSNEKRSGNLECVGLLSAVCLQCLSVPGYCPPCFCSGFLGGKNGMEWKSFYLEISDHVDFLQIAHQRECFLFSSGYIYIFHFKGWQIPFSHFILLPDFGRTTIKTYNQPVNPLQGLQTTKRLQTLHCLLNHYIIIEIQFTLSIVNYIKKFFFSE